MSSTGLHTAARRAYRGERRRFDAAHLGTALLRRLPPNMAHTAAIKLLRYGLLPSSPAHDDAILANRLWGIDFANPIGMAAGFDKDAQATDGLLGLGFGFAEAGTVTPLPQAGNPRPNLFRLEEDAALINRLGFPSSGLTAFVANLARCRERRTGVIGANIGINTGTEDPVRDIVTGVRALAPLADYLVINVSCPNTPGLCQWQTADRLAEITGAALAVREEAAGGRRPPVLIKIAPDLSDTDLVAVAEVSLKSGVDGLIATNTTVARPASLRSARASESGGLSGPPLFAASTEALSQLYRLTGGRLPLIGCGGVSSGADAYAKIRAGASLVQLYTALVYGGPGLVGEIKQSLAAHLRADGFQRLSDAVGADHR
jgi:dihydroorotate dehydrogenase